MSRVDVTVSETIDRPVGKVAGFAGDPSNAPTWSSAVVGLATTIACTAWAASRAASSRERWITAVGDDLCSPRGSRSAPDAR